MKTPHLFAALAVTSLAGCVHPPSPSVFVREVPTQVTSTNTLDVIRFPATYKAYTVGRRIDPANRGLMHETHVLYVRESPDRWNLQPPISGTGVTIPANVTNDAAFSPLPIEQHLRTELQEQRRISQTLHDRTQQFQEAADTFASTARKAVEQFNQIQQRQALFDERLRRLEEGSRWSHLTNWPPASGTIR